MPGTKTKTNQSLQTGPVCQGTLNTQQACPLPPPFASCLCRAAGPLGAGRGESVGPSQVSPERAHGPRRVSSIPDFQQCVGAFPKRLTPQPLLPSFLVSLFFAPTIIFIRCLSKHFRVSDFHKLPGGPLQPWESPE